MERHKLYLQGEADTKQRLGVVQIPKPTPGQVLRVSIKQPRAMDLRVLAVNEASHEVTTSSVEGTATALHLLELLVYKVHEARCSDVDVAYEIAQATHSFRQLCLAEGTSAMCDNLRRAIKTLDRHTKERQNG